ncbi:signal peptidase I [Cytobacillus purgationiresistens]|uniref:Signal peptidase I n=1 Tax=Cytobacillus purgationiresistens TaxID=863449 RepID=A0ABU0AKE1_9BACI|nr:signal peptidase I [Cytobacillus purgationiresistens]MDQ0271354.1 signal peptidase I [Cytobacillus purgationiresistens]
MDSAIKEEIISWIKTILFALLIAFICRQFIFSPVTVKGESMSPTFEENNWLFVSKTSTIDRFDRVVFDAPDKDERYVKRIIGIPGDEIEMKDDKLYVNGEVYEEPYVKKEYRLLDNKTTADFTLDELTGKKTVPEGYYFVLGDNRKKSHDSRRFGFITEESLIGEVKFRIYPFN